MHAVQIKRDFFISTFELQQWQYEYIMGYNPSFFDACGGQCPVERVSWFDAIRFANALSLAEEKTPCYEVQGASVEWSEGLDCEGYRLPTESEWEYAARGGEDCLYAGSDDGDTVAWYSLNSSFQLMPVGQKSPNAFGLYDMSGNVNEWVWDAFADYPSEEQVDPVGPIEGEGRVNRSGSWQDDLNFVRVVNRSFAEPGSHSASIGFRLVRTAD